jgi:hypothetical protein
MMAAMISASTPLATFILAIAAGSVALAGCSSDADTSAPDSTPAEQSDPSSADAEAVPAPGSVSPAVSQDACELLTAQEVLAVLGYSAAAAESISLPGDAYALSGCTWGGADQGVYLSLQIFTPGAIEDPIGLLVGASGETSTPVAGLPGGEAWNLGFLPGGGGQGYTITWDEGSDQAALSVLGENITTEQQDALATAAEQVSAALA